MKTEYSAYGFILYTDTINKIVRCKDMMKNRLDIYNDGERHEWDYASMHENGIKGCICSDINCDYDDIKNLHRLDKLQTIDGTCIMTYSFYFECESYIVRIHEHFENEGCSFYYIRLL